MRVSDLLIQTSKGLTANKIRSALTILGIVIGIASVIAMTALINGISVALVGQLGLDQAQLVYINVWAAPLTYEDVDRMSANLPGYDYITAFSGGEAAVNTGRKKKNASLFGVKPDYFKAMKTKFVYGKPFTNADEDGQALKVILDQKSVRILFQDMNKDVTGTEVKIGREQYRIVGVIESDPTTSSMKDTVTAFLPFSTMSSRVTGTSDIWQVIGCVSEDEDIDAMVKETSDYIARTYNISDDAREDSMSVYSMKSLIDSMNAATSSFSILMTSVGSISLVVGGIGIMNMMLTNVTERIREIGLRKALGATRFDITSQFLLESVFLCLIGGLIGIALGYFGAFVLADIAGESLISSMSGDVSESEIGYEGAEQSESMQVVPTIDVDTVMLASGICVGIGVVFGWYPAYHAAKMDPVESLHYQ